MGDYGSLGTNRRFRRGNMRSHHVSRLGIQLFFIDLIITPIGLYFASYLRGTLPIGQGGALPQHVISLPWQVYAFAILSWTISLAFNGAYHPERVLRWYQEAVRVFSGSVMAAILMAGALFMTFRETSRLQLIYFFLINVLLLLGYRALLRIYYRIIGRKRPGARSRVLVLGAGEVGQRSAKVILDLSRWGFDLIGFLDDDPAKIGQKFEDVPVVGNIDELKRIVEQRKIEEVWITLPARAHEKVKWIVSELEKHPVQIKIVPDYYSLALITAKPEILGGVPIIGLRNPVIEGLPRLVKRGFDLVIGSLLLLLAFPPMLLIAIALKLDSSGPLFFRQERVGENGRLFSMYKFRTMVAYAEAQQSQINIETEDDEIIHKRPDDPRVTKVGHFLRRYSLDELPQLVNVLKGDMSLVGPRPEMPWLVDRYESWQRKRFAVPQGITGWWQINGRSDKPMHLNPEDDLYYVYNYSLGLDIQILLRTPLAVLRGVGAF